MNLMDIYQKLFAAFGEQHWWPAKTPFEMMTGAILTQNTAWSNVEKAIANFDDNLSPEFILEISQDELAEIIRPSGFFNQKAARLKTLAAWFKRYGCDIDRLRSQDPETIRRELLSLSGVGRETADSIMLYALAKPYFIVDAYTRRVFTRLGLSLPEDYDDVRNIVERSIPRDADLYGEFHALIVKLAKLNCKKKPNCEGCPLISSCEFGKTEQNPQKP